MSLSERAKAFSIDSILSSSTTPRTSDSDDVDNDKPMSNISDAGADVPPDAVDEGRCEEEQVFHPNPGFDFNGDTHFNPRLSAWRGLSASRSTLFSSTSTLNSASSMTDINFGSSSNLRRSSDEVDVPLETSPFGSGYRFGALALNDDPLSNSVPMILCDLDDDVHPISLTVNGIKASLTQSSMWRKFHECETEMIINRSGRRMFPCFAVSLTGLQPEALYRIYVTITSDNRSRYKFINGKWLAVGKADPEMPNEPYEHTSSPNNGLFWESNVVSFAKLKITNNKDTKAKNQIVLHSMHKYAPRLYIERLASDTPSHTNPSEEPSSSSHSMSTSPSRSTWLHMQGERRSTDHSSSDTASTSTGIIHLDGSSSLSQAMSSSLDHHHVDQTTCISFLETSFIAVTAYQNDYITQLKIQNNPFAKAFRDAEVAAMLQGAHMFHEQHHLLEDYREREAFSSTHSLNAHMTGKRRCGLPVMQRIPAHLGLVPGHHQPLPMTRSMANVQADPGIENSNRHLLGYDLHWKVSGSATNLASPINDGAIHESCGFLPTLNASQRALSDAELSGKSRTGGASRSPVGSPFGGLGQGSEGDFRRRAIFNLVDDRRNSDKDDGDRGIGSHPTAAEDSGGTSSRNLLMVPTFPFSPHQRHHMRKNGGDLTRRVTIHTAEAYATRGRDSPVMKPRRSLDSAKMSASLYHFPGSAYSPRLNRRTSSAHVPDYNGSCLNLDEETVSGFLTDD